MTAIFTVRNGTCGKVMFSQAYVKNFVHGGCIPACTGQGGVCSGGCLPGGCVPGGVCLGVCLPWGVCPGWCSPRRVSAQGVGGVCPEGVYTPPPDQGRHNPGPEAETPCSRDGHCSRRNASYWNAFLFVIKFNELIDNSSVEKLDHGQ